MERLQEVSTRLSQDGDMPPLLLEIVDAAIAITAADMGNIQLLDRESGTLKFVASRGFGREYPRRLRHRPRRSMPPAAAAMMERANGSWSAT